MLVRYVGMPIKLEWERMRVCILFHAHRCLVYGSNMWMTDCEMGLWNCTVSMKTVREFSRNRGTTTTQHNRPVIWDHFFIGPTVRVHVRLSGQVLSNCGTYVLCTLGSAPMGFTQVTRCEPGNTNKPTWTVSPFSPSANSRSYTAEIDIAAQSLYIA